MKKLIASLLAAAMVCLSLPVFAAANITLETVVDYDNEEITVSGVTPAKYGQGLSVVVYKLPASVDEYADITNKENPEAEFPLTAITDIERAEFCKAKYDGSYEYTFSLKDIATGYYIVSIAGNGYLSAASKESAVIYVEPKGSIDSVTIPAINGANEVEMENLFRQKEVLFDIDLTGWYVPNKDAINSLMISIKNEDYDGSYKSFTDVQDAIKTIELLLQLYAQTTPAGVQTLVEPNAAEIGFDITNPDYTAAKDATMNTFLTVMGAKKPVSNTGFLNALMQSVGMYTINNHVSSQIAGDMDKYANYFKTNFLKDYQDACTLYGETEINKAFVDQGFTQPDQLPTALTTRIAAILEELGSGNGGNNEGTPGGTGNGNGGGGNGGGGYVPLPPVVLPNSKVPAEDTTPTFSDVSASHWSYEAVSALAELGVIDGVGGGKFAPNDVVTRAALTKMLVNAMSINAPGAVSEFSDVDISGWAYPYISIAAAKGIVTGYPDNTFSPNATVTRQDASVMAVRAATEAGIRLLDTTGAEVTDFDAVSDYAQDSIVTVTKSGVMSGFEDGSFRPLETLTRAQAAKLIYEIIKLS